MKNFIIQTQVEKLSVTNKTKILVDEEKLLDILLHLTTTLKKFRFTDPNGLKDSSMKHLSKCKSLQELEMSFRFVQSSGFHYLSKLQKLEVFIAAQDTLNISRESLIRFFANMKHLRIVDISGSSTICSEAMLHLANNNRNLTHLYLNTYLLSANIIEIVKEKCPIKIIKFSPEITFNNSH